MDNKNQPAFPDTRRAAAQSFSNQTPEDLPTGLTKLEFFACNAPVDIPGWFKHTPPKLEEVKAPNASSIVNEEHRKQAIDWVRDPIYDLPQELDWFQKQYEMYWESKRLSAIADEQAKYFQWRRFYAEQLLSELSK